MLKSYNSSPWHQPNVSYEIIRKLWLLLDICLCLEDECMWLHISFSPLLPYVWDNWVTFHKDLEKLNKRERGKTELRIIWNWVYQILQTASLLCIGFDRFPWDPNKIHLWWLGELTTTCLSFIPHRAVPQFPFVHIFNFNHHELGVSKFLPNRE